MLRATFSLLGYDFEHAVPLVQELLRYHKWWRMHPTFLEPTSSSVIAACWKAETAEAEEDTVTFQRSQGQSTGFVSVPRENPEYSQHLSPFSELSSDGENTGCEEDVDAADLLQARDQAKQRTWPSKIEVHITDDQSEPPHSRSTEWEDVKLKGDDSKVEAEWLAAFLQGLHEEEEEEEGVEEKGVKAYRSPPLRNHQVMIGNVKNGCECVEGANVGGRQGGRWKG